jgi:hypothetical protein
MSSDAPDSSTDKKSADDAKPDATAATTDAKPVNTADKPDDVKRAFREALDRKKNQRHAHAEGGNETGKVHAHDAVATKRMFRRKSG